MTISRSAYSRPFQKEPSPVRSRGSGGIFLPERIRRLRRGYSRALLGAAVLSIITHGIVVYGLKDQFSSFEPPQTIGYRGPTLVLDIVPEPDNEQARDLALEQYQVSALEAIDVVFETAEVQPEVLPEESFDVPTDAPPLVFEAPPTVAQKLPDEPLLFQLREDWTVDPSSPQASFSDLLHPIRVVVPDYPRLAVINDVEGRVLLQAEVGISGRILDIQVIEPSAGSLTMSACRALLLWQFEPVIVNGKAQRFKVLIPFRAE
jgi:TonB family protein